MTSIECSALTNWSIQVLGAAGLKRIDAEAVARNLAYAELRGTSSHGFIRLGTYLERVVAGGINASHQPTLLWDLGALAAVDADAGPGAATGTYAVELAMLRAEKFGIGCIAVRNGNHFGAAAYYAELIADHHMIGIVSCNTDKAMCAPGGGRPVLGTNPLAIALPLPPDERPILDMATSAVSYGKVLVADQDDEAIPFGWAVDASGKPTKSPRAGLEGALLPAAGPKGFGLAFMIDSLVALGGASTSPHVSPLHGDASRPQALGQLFIAVRLSAEQDNTDAVRELMEQVRDSQLPGTPEVLYPGEPEQRNRHQQNGVLRVPEGLARSLHEIALNYQVPLPAPLASKEWT